MVLLTLTLMGCEPQQNMVDAIRSGDVQSVNRHLRRGYNPNERQPPPNASGYLLHIVANNCLEGDGSEDYVQIAQLIINAGGNVDGHNDANATPLFDAAGFGCIDLMKLFIDNGSDVNATNNVGSVPLHSAAGNLKYEACQLLIDSGALVNVFNEMGYTPVTIAASVEGEWEETVKVLLNSGADYTRPNQQGRVINEARIKRIATEIGR